MEPILNRDAESRGFSRAVLRSPAYVHPVDGVSMPAGWTGDLVATCRTVAQKLAPRAVFTHLTSAQLRGWWLPPLDDVPLIACTDSDAPHHDRRGVYVRRCGIPDRHREWIGGVPVASAAWTIVELAEHLALVDLVAVIDGALHQGDVTVAAIRAAMVPGRRGVRVLRRALGLCDGRSESPWETILRLMHVLSGIDVEPQHLVENEMGVVVARGDLWIVGTRRLAEYDGADHRDRGQHERDLRREKILARLGLERYGYTAAELLREPDRVIRDADDARGVAHDPTRVHGWLREVQKSSLTPHGLAALNRRLRRFVRDVSPRASGAKRGTSGA
jgi:very-short-patch-repair endonuclease